MQNLRPDENNARPEEASEDATSLSELMEFSELRASALRPVGQSWWVAKTTLFWLLRGVLVLLMAFGLFVVVAMSMQVYRRAPQVFSADLGILTAGIVGIISGVGLWLLKRWGWVLTFLLGFGLAAFLGGHLGAAIGGNLLIISTLFFDFHAVISPDVDRVAQTLGIHWGETPLPSIDRLVRNGQTSEAQTKYREIFRCSAEEARAAIRFWQSETTVRKLRYLAKVLSDKPAHPTPPLTLE